MFEEGRLVESQALQCLAVFYTRHIHQFESPREARSLRSRIDMGFFALFFRDPLLRILYFCFVNSE